MTLPVVGTASVAVSNGGTFMLGDATVKIVSVVPLVDLTVDLTLKCP